MMSHKVQHSIKVPRLYKQAAKVLKETSKGENLKELIYSQTNRFQNLKALYALVHESIHNTNVLDLLIEKSGILAKEERLDPWLAKILITELLWGKKHLGGDSKPVKTVLSYKQKLLNVLNSSEVFGIKSERKNAEKLPRFVRINTLKMSVKDVIASLKGDGWEQIFTEVNTYNSYIEAVSRITNKQFVQDFHIKEVLAFPSGTLFYDHELYVNGILILQNKASCFPSYILDPKPGSVVLDMCAAPGMKTSHLAAIMKDKGKIYAIEKNEKRFNVLKKMLNTSGVTCVETLHSDSMLINSETCPGVEYILLDPSCSGSGIVNRLDLCSSKPSDETRFQRLAAFQSKLLHHALMSFPCVKRIVYSTCSLNAHENEVVIDRVMSDVESDVNSQTKFQVAMALPKECWNNFGSDEYMYGPSCIYSLPNRDLTTGFFVAVINRVPDFCEREKVLLKSLECSSEATNVKKHKKKKHKSQ